MAARLPCWIAAENGELFNEVEVPRHHLTAAE